MNVDTNRRSRDEADDLVIQALAGAEHELREQNEALIALAADLFWECWRQRAAFIHVLKIADDARTEAQRQADALWTELARIRQDRLDREREAA